MKRTSGLAFLSTLLALAGCGGGSSGTVASTPVAKATGTATMNVIWSNDAGRLIPAAANSLTVTLSLNGTPVSTQTIARPASGQTQTSTTFTDLPIGSLSVSVSAFPSTDGSGVAQAIGSGTMAVAVGVPGAVTVSLVSTVASLAVSPASPHIGLGGSGTLTVSAHDASNNIVLLQATGTESIAWSSSATGVATVSGSGPSATVSGVATGTSTITASFVTDDAGDTVSGTASITVVPGSGTVTIK